MTSTTNTMPRNALGVAFDSRLFSYSMWQDVDKTQAPRALKLLRDDLKKAVEGSFQKGPAWTTARTLEANKWQCDYTIVNGCVYIDAKWSVPCSASEYIDVLQDVEKRKAFADNVDSITPVISTQDCLLAFTKMKPLACGMLRYESQTCTYIGKVGEHEYDCLTFSCDCDKAPPPSPGYASVLVLFRQLLLKGNELSKACDVSLKTVFVLDHLPCCIGSSQAVSMIMASFDSVIETEQEYLSQGKVKGKRRRDSIGVVPY